MTLRLAAFEWRYAAARVTFWAAAALFAVMGFALAATEFGPADVAINGAYAVTYSVGFLSLISVFASTVLAAPSLLRDREYQMAEMVYSTSVTKSDYLMGKLLGSLLVVLTAFAFSLPGLWAGTFLAKHDPSRLVGFHVSYYLSAFTLLAVPSTFFVTALLFAVAALTRSTLATYVGGTALYVLYHVAALLTSSPIMAGAKAMSAEAMAVAALLDPFGLSAFLEQTHHFTAAERNVRLVELSGHFLASRLIFTAVAAGILAFAYRRFAFRVDDEKKRKTEGADPTPTPSVPYRATPPDARRSLAPFWSATRLDVLAVLQSKPFVVLLLLWVGGALIESLQTFQSAELGTAL
ncbi:MAG TPA: hypothetical protein VGR00_14915, partial [Thermoanaerobaculia bacterium]|nr:hypothetical protein [Thermoanaerobaculia bacterium]